jgi:hypothetical protein
VAAAVAAAAAAAKRATAPLGGAALPSAPLGPFAVRVVPVDGAFAVAREVFSLAAYDAHCFEDDYHDPVRARRRERGSDATRRPGETLPLSFALPFFFVFCFRAGHKVSTTDTYTLRPAALALEFRLAPDLDALGADKDHPALLRLQLRADASADAQAGSASALAGAGSAAGAGGGSGVGFGEGSRGAALTWSDFAPLHWRALDGRPARGEAARLGLCLDLLDDGGGGGWSFAAAMGIALRDVPPVPRPRKPEASAGDGDGDGGDDSETDGDESEGGGDDREGDGGGAAAVEFKVRATGGSAAHPPKCFRGAPGAPPHAPPPRPLHAFEKRRLRRTCLAKPRGLGGSSNSSSGGAYADQPAPPPDPLATVSVRMPAPAARLLRRGLSFAAAVAARVRRLKAAAASGNGDGQTEQAGHRRRILRDIGADDEEQAAEAVTLAALRKGLWAALAPAFDGATFTVGLPPDASKKRSSLGP